MQALKRMDIFDFFDYIETNKDAGSRTDIKSRQRSIHK